MSIFLLFFMGDCHLLFEQNCEKWGRLHFCYIKVMIIQGVKCPEFHAHFSVKVHNMSSTTELHKLSKYGYKGTSAQFRRQQETSLFRIQRRFDQLSSRLSIWVVSVGSVEKGWTSKQALTTVHSLEGLFSQPRCKEWVQRACYVWEDSEVKLNWLVLHSKNLE